MPGVFRLAYRGRTDRKLRLIGQDIFRNKYGRATGKRARASRARLSMQSQSLDKIGAAVLSSADRAVLQRDATQAGRTNKRRIIRICTDGEINGTEKPRRLSIAQQEIRALEGVFSWTIFCGNS
jgi:hypothetical protein